MSSSPVATETVLEALTAALGRAARYNRSALVAPAAVLWPDETRQWEPPWRRCYASSCRLS